MNSNIFIPTGSFQVVSSYSSSTLDVCLCSSNEILGRDPQKAISVSITRLPLVEGDINECSMYLSIEDTERLISKFVDLLFVEQALSEAQEAPALNPASQKLLKAIQLSSITSMRRENEKMTNKHRSASVDFIRPLDHQSALGVVYEALKAKANPAYQKYLSILSIVYNMVECNGLEPLYLALMDKFSEYDLSKHPNGI